MDKYLAVIRVWAAAAWADGVVTPEESAAMTKLIDSTPLGPDDKAMAMTWIEEPVSLDDGIDVDLSDRSKLGVFRAAIKLIMVDKVVAPAEREFIDELRVALEIDEEAASQLEASLQ